MPNYDVGKFEQIILVAVRILGENAYGMTIHSKAEDLSGRWVSLGAVYTTLDRLEQKGFISSQRGGATAVRGGRQKRQVKLVKAGTEALDASLRLSASIVQAGLVAAAGA